MKYEDSIKKVSCFDDIITLLRQMKQLQHFKPSQFMIDDNRQQKKFWIGKGWKAISGVACFRRGIAPLQEQSCIKSVQGIKMKPCYDKIDEIW